MGNNEQQPRFQEKRINAKDFTCCCNMKVGIVLIPQKVKSPIERSE